MPCLKSKIRNVKCLNRWSKVCPKLSGLNAFDESLLFLAQPVTVMGAALLGWKLIFFFLKTFEKFPRNIKFSKIKFGFARCPLLKF